MQKSIEKAHPVGYFPPKMSAICVSFKGAITTSSWTTDNATLEDYDAVDLFE